MPTSRPIDPRTPARIRRAIAASGLTNLAFATEVLVVSEVQLYRLLRGERQLTGVQREKIANLLARPVTRTPPHHAT